MPLSIAIQIGRRIQALREKRGLTQIQFADQAGIGRAHLSQIENGAVAAKIDTLDIIAKALGASIGEMFKDL